MNGREPRQFAPNTFWHIYNRGNGKRDIFLDDEDRAFFLFRLKENLYPVPQMTVIPDDSHLGSGGAYLIAEAHTPYIRKTLPPGSFTLLSHCLMPNHFHLEIRQNGDIPVSLLVSKVCTSYGKYFNQKYEQVGHLFQDRFKAVLIETGSQLMWLSAYIHNNPKTAGLITDLKNYPWSSYLDYLGLRQGTLCDKDFILKMFQNNTAAYKTFVNDAALKIQERKDLQHLLLD